MLKQYVKARALEVRYELEDLLLSKEVWLALLGVIVAISKWQGWNIPTDIFLTIEVLIVVVIMALTKKPVS
jgi:hypothetical protein